MAGKEDSGLCMGFLVGAPPHVRFEAEKEKIPVQPTDALLVIDVEGTFMPGGGLPVKGGDEIVPMIREQLIPKFRPERCIATKDRHLWGSVSLASSYTITHDNVLLFVVRMSGSPLMAIVAAHTFNVEWDFGRKIPRELDGINLAVIGSGLEERQRIIAPHAKFDAHALGQYLAQVGYQILWPDHGIAGTEEAELHEDLSSSFERSAEDQFGYVLVKGTNPCEDSNSAFKGNAGTPTELADVLRARGVKRIFCCGLAKDVCVRMTAEHGNAEGFEVFVVEDATRSVFPENDDELRRSFAEKGIHVIQSDQLIAA